MPKGPFESLRDPILLRAKQTMIKKIVLFTSIALLIMGGVILFAPSKTVLSISNRKNSNQRIYSSLAYKNGFIISYTHSVNKGRVHDFYKCDQEEEALVLQSTHFVSYGAGIPEPEETPGATFIALDNCYIISNINRVVPKLVMAVGLIADHGFAIAEPDFSSDYENDFNNIEGEIFLTDYFPPQTSLIFEIDKVSLAGYLAHKID